MEAVKYTYSLGLCGYELWPDPDDCQRMMVQFVGTEKKDRPKSYRIFVRNEKLFVRVSGRRVYLNQCMRCT